MQLPSSTELYVSLEEQAIAGAFVREPLVPLFQQRFGCGDLTDIRAWRHAVGRTGTVEENNDVVRRLDQKYIKHNSKALLHPLSFRL